MFQKYKFGKFDWVEGIATIATINGVDDVVAYRTCMIPGLAVTQGPFGLWCVTHDASGRRMNDCFFEVLRNAIEAVEEECAGLDWVSIKADGVSDPPEEYVRAAQMVFMQADYETETLDMAFNR
jgi:hypothetical protein